ELLNQYARDSSSLDEEERAAYRNQILEQLAGILGLKGSLIENIESVARIPKIYERFYNDEYWARKGKIERNLQEGSHFAGGALLLSLVIQVSLIVAESLPLAESLPPLVAINAVSLAVIFAKAHHLDK